MLDAAHRLRRSSDFAATIRGGRRAGRGTLVVHLSIPVPRTTSEPAPAGSFELPARAGFVVSRAVGNAVVRNRVQRRLRHLLRERIGDLPADSTLVVRALPAAAGATGAVLAADLDAAVAAARAPRSGRGARRGRPQPAGAS